MESYSEFLTYLGQRTMMGVKFGLDNINSLLKKLGSPHKKLKFIHIAGTNGKGSVAAMLSAVLNQAGIKVGLYTSPHLVDVRERIRINEMDISEEEILVMAKRVVAVCRPETTYFEFLTAIAIEYFYEKKTEIVIMETGMGGRLDATNACDAGIAIITDISLEHTDYLGKSIEDITKEKMAIIKKNTKAILAKDLDRGYNIYSRTLDGQTCRIGKYDKIKLNLLGDHQIRNCSLALKALQILTDKGYNIPRGSIYKGLENVRWPGRFQILSHEPLIILDGAHNPGAALVLKDTVEKYLKSKVVLIVGILKDKDYKSVIDILNPIAEKIVTVTPKNERAVSGEELRRMIKDKPVEYIEDVNDAIICVKDNLPVLVTGSLYLLGEVLEKNENNNI